MFEHLRARFGGDSTADTPPDVDGEDRLFDVLANARRRRLLTVLDDHRDGLSQRELAERLAAREEATTISALDRAQYKSVYITLSQCHLPRLADAEVIDPIADGDDTVRPGPAFGTTLAALEAVRDVRGGESG